MTCGECVLHHSGSDEFGESHYCNLVGDDCIDSEDYHDPVFDEWLNRLCVRNEERIQKLLEQLIEPGTDVEALVGDIASAHGYDVEIWPMLKDESEG
jgi:hypothetical protein